MLRKIRDYLDHLVIAAILACFANVPQTKRRPSGSVKRRLSG